MKTFSFALTGALLLIGSNAMAVGSAGDCKQPAPDPAVNFPFERKSAVQASGVVNAGSLAKSACEEFKSTEAAVCGSAMRNDLVSADNSVMTTDDNIKRIMVEGAQNMQIQSAQLDEKWKTCEAEFKSAKRDCEIGIATAERAIKNYDTKVSNGFCDSGNKLSQAEKDLNLAKSYQGSAESAKAADEAGKDKAQAQTAAEAANLMDRAGRVTASGSDGEKSAEQVAEEANRDPAQVAANPPIPILVQKPDGSLGTMMSAPYDDIVNKNCDILRGMGCRIIEVGPGITGK